MAFPSLTYKIAQTEKEYEQIYHLNYKTFVEEIPQHQENQQHQLIDRFDDENIYVIAKQEEEVIAMICVRDKRPFSLDEKLSDLDEQLGLYGELCEIRLLSIKQEYRKGLVFFRLVSELVSYCLKQGYTVALISGTTTQLRLYQKIGFVPFGPLVGKKDAYFQPMYLTEDNFVQATKAFRKITAKRSHFKEQLFLPGPVSMTSKVQQAWSKPPFSHRSETMATVVKEVKEELLSLTSGHFVEIAVGTGTMANEMIAGQLAKVKEHGAIIASGEFGERLLEQAERWDLSFDRVHHQDWSPVSLDSIKTLLAGNRAIKWLWTVHCETSTGYLYPLEELKQLCNTYKVKLCVDACSSLGCVPVNLSGVYLASSVSGKGLASYPGLALVFYQYPTRPANMLPSYLDLGLYCQNNSVPFTHSTNLITALHQALQDRPTSSTSLWYQIKDLMEVNELDTLKFNHFSPAILTIRLPERVNSKKLGDALKLKSIFISYESSYLLSRNWIQIALMGRVDHSNALKAARIIANTYHAYAGEKVMN
ncbi:aspartate aminotransferase-like enzyme/GNAT superfamily N-acetyltransferase [Alkalihalobacillus xiaoxiensis]|uniref:Aspartate aminotransferase-like enzyme/GNAT superfamily N-acetyltransferase n=1 Tax=Shouchella xiaoxiensis TaxID=766895 RepID=A0ABS2SWV4_9BACI|nr:GNAT family N-acetyltransferase [Shouchella xiaoxiensis]MBM7840017.1 aspartate aminotransferase-like enzyme/GNAT superfamily N-acetyltransferase [Shouchella xiaoxiensis]